MFYKMFLDEGVRANLSEYDALAIIEWDVLVATDKSFEELYHAAFRVNEDFWVKGSNLEGTNFHSTSTYNDMWHVMGHINGNAIYNNNDPMFVEYVDYTRTRFEYEYPYDVALWLTISDFPYSWPLYQRFSTKFVTTNLVSGMLPGVLDAMRLPLLPGFPLLKRFPPPPITFSAWKHDVEAFTPGIDKKEKRRRPFLNFPRGELIVRVAVTAPPPERWCCLILTRFFRIAERDVPGIFMLRSPHNAAQTRKKTTKSGHEGKPKVRKRPEQ